MELILGRFRLEGPSLGVSDFLATGPLGEGMAMERGLGATEPALRSVFGAGFISRTGVLLADGAGEAAPARIEVSMRLTWGRDRCAAGVVASGRAISSMISSCDSDAPI